MNILRTPDECFENLPDFSYEPHYTEVPSGGRGGSGESEEGARLRIHHVEAGPSDAEAIVCMHGQPTWSYLYRHMIPVLADAGLRVLAPDLVGFGRSDKPAAREDYSYQRQVDWLTAWLEANDIRDATLFCQDWGGLIGLRMVAENPERFARVVAANTGIPAPAEIPQERIDRAREFLRSHATPTMEELAKALGSQDPAQPEQTFVYWQKFTWETEDLPIGTLIAGSVDGCTLSPGEIAAYDAPFPDPSFKMGPRAMPTQVPILPDDPSVPANRRAWQSLSKFEKPFLCCFSDNDPVTRGGDVPMRERIPGAKGQPHRTLRGGGHFLQEAHGKELAQIIADFVAANPKAGR